MKVLSRSLLIAVATVFVATASPVAAKTVWEQIGETAPRTVFDDIRDTAPKMVFEGDRRDLNGE